MVNNIAIIPARGGSVRIPRKNIVDFFGKPMIAYTIEAALQSDVFNKVVVSTEDEEIAAISRQFGAEVPFMREKFADSHSGVDEVLCYALQQAQEHYGETFDNVGWLQPSSPTRDFEDVRNAYAKFIETNTTCLSTIFRFGWMNPWWAMRLNEGRSEFIFDGVSKRSQDYDTLYSPTGAVGFVKAEALQPGFDFFGADSEYYELDWKKAIDIDDPEDVEMAMAVWGLLYSKQ